MTRRPLLSLGMTAAIVMAAACTTGGTGSTPSTVRDGNGAPATVEPATVAPNPAAGGITGWLGTYSNGVVFIQWTVSGTSLTGSMTQTLTTGMTTTPQNASFTGVLNGSAVSLTFQGGFGATWNGTLNGDQLLLSFPEPDGSLGTVTMVPGTAADYDAAVAQLQVDAASAQASAAASASDAAAASAAAQQLQQDQAGIDQGVQVVGGDLQSVQGDVGALNKDVAAVPNDLTQEYKDLKTTYADLQTTLTAKQQGVDNATVCGDAATVGGDANTVGGDDNTIGGDGNIIGGDVGIVNHAVGQLKADFSTLQQWMATLPSYRPAGIPSAEDVDAAATAANDAIGQANTTYAGYKKQSAAYVAEAQGYANDAQAACG